MLDDDDPMLAAASAGQRAAVARALPRLLATVRRAWSLRADEVPERLPEQHGCLSASEMRRVVDEAVAELVMPGFAHLGLT